MTRRLAAAAGALAAALALAAGCSPPQEPGPDPDARVEVVTWWASGSEKLAFDVLSAAFREANPDVRYVDAGIAGGAGSTAKDVLASRMANDDPPDAFQVHGGAELAAHVRAGDVADLSALYEELGLDAVLPEVVRDLVSVDGVPYAVPTNVHRANLLWANPAVLSAAGLDPSATFATLDDWFAALEKVRASGRTALVLGAPWTQVHLLEQVLLSRLGPAGYAGLWDGTTDPSSAAVASALGDVARLLGFANADRDALDWPDAAERVGDGDAAFLVMGDWAQQTLGPPVLWAPFPGTDGVVDLVVDAFAVPVGAPDPDAARLWLRTAADHDVQVRFANAKGAVPARGDVSAAELESYPRSALEALGTDRIVLSLAHGAVAGPEELADLTAMVARLARGQASTSQVQAALAAAARPTGR